MKKFNFFPVLLVAFFMIFGLTAKAQSYLPTQKAIDLVEDALINLEKTQPTVLLSASASQTTFDASYVHSLKIAVGNEILEPLKSGSSVSIVLTAQFNKMKSINDAKFKSAIDEVETYYRTLLKTK